MKTSVYANNFTLTPIILCFFMLILAYQLSMAAIPGKTSVDNSKQEINKLFNKALQERERGNVYKAIALLQHIIAIQPSLHRAHLELALTYYQAGQFNAARTEAMQVLNTVTTPETVKITIQAFLKQIDKTETEIMERRRVLDSFVSFGFGHDTNVNIGPGGKNITIGGDVLELADGSTRQSDIFGTLTLGAAHSFAFPGSMKVGKRAGFLAWESKGIYYHKNHDEETGFNLDVVSLASGPALVLPEQWRVALDMQLDYIELGHDQLAWFSGINPNLILTLNNQNHLTIGLQWTDRHYTQQKNAGREGKHVGTEVGYDYNWKWLQRIMRLELTGKYYQDDTEQERFTKVGQEVGIGMEWELWQQGAVFAEFKSEWSDYVGEEPLFAVARNERERKVLLGARQDLKRFGWEQWQLDTYLARTLNSSNISIYDYQRNEAVINVTKRF